MFLLDLLLGGKEISIFSSRARLEGPMLGLASLLCRAASMASGEWVVLWPGGPGGLEGRVGEGGPGRPGGLPRAGLGRIPEMGCVV